jgi:hypothetical protein
VASPGAEFLNPQIIEVLEKDNHNLDRARTGLVNENRINLRADLLEAAAPALPLGWSTALRKRSESVALSQCGPEQFADRVRGEYEAD